MVARTVLHGADMSAETNALALIAGAKGNMAHQIYDERGLGLLLRDTTKSVFVPVGGLISHLYDFTVHAGAIGSINLGLIPAGFIIKAAFYDVITTFTTAGADAGTIRLTAEAAGDIVAATAVSAGGNVRDAGLHVAIPDEATAAEWVKTTVERQLVMAIAGQVVTAGKMRIFLQGALSTVT